MHNSKARKYHGRQRKFLMDIIRQWAQGCSSNYETRPGLLCYQNVHSFIEDIYTIKYQSICTSYYYVM